MAQHDIHHIDQLRAFIGKDVFTSWQPVTQGSIDQFAEATSDHQWIHVDVARSRRESPFGEPIAHGFLSLSLLAPMLYEAFDMDKLGMGVNYGCNRVRFVAPVRAGSRVRGRFTLDSVEALAPAGGQGPGVQMVWNAVIERESEERPALVAEWITRRYAS
ncbi:MAG: MaoC family dehydratase [Burkholderiales bacterium]